LLKKHFKYSSIIFILFFSQFFLFGQEYGLKFKGQSFLLDERTELNLTPNDFFTPNTNFKISFDIKIDISKNVGSFGYVFRIISKNNKNIDLLLSSFPFKKEFTLLVDNAKTLISIEKSKLKNKSWAKIEISFLFSENKIIFKLDGLDEIQQNLPFNKSDEFKLFFGANTYKEFVNKDVPEMQIRDIKIYKNNKLKNHFPLKQCGGKTAIDIVGNGEAQVINPKWLLCKHEKWNLDFSSEIIGTQLVTANEKEELLYLVNNTSLLIYSIENQTIKKIPFKKAINLTSDYRLLYNTNDKKIYCYLSEKQLLAVLDPISGEWTNDGIFDIGPSKKIYTMHNSIFNKDENAIYMIGGYGQFKYFDDVFKLDLNTQKWEKRILKDSIFKPRYLAGGDILGDTIYILGGYGSPTGSQLMSPKSYFDFVAYNIKTNAFKIKFEIKKHVHDMVVANRIWIDKTNKDYYALTYDKIKFEGHLKLLKGNLNSKESSYVGDSIPYKFLDIKSFSNMYYMPKSKKLVVYNSYFNKKDISEFTIYSISFPVIPITKNNTKPINSLFWYVSIFGIIGILAIGSFIYFKRIKKTKSQNSNSPFIETKTNDVGEVEEEEVIEFNTSSKKPNYQIIFFGGFQVFDSNQVDITSKFSPLLKEMFLLIWLYTFKNNKGISSEKLIEILWFDKSSRRAQNNRSVNLTKLKGLLNQIGGCSLSKETGYWKIEHDHELLKTDYFEFYKITENKKEINYKRIKRLIEIAAKGQFLLNVNVDWLEPFKEATTDKIINTLVTFAESFDIKSDPDFILNLADCVLNFDTINEEAVKFKCKAYSYKGNHSLALSTFKKFQKEYKYLYAQDYPLGFNKILES